MSGRHREPAALRVARTGHGCLSRAAMEYLGWPTRIVIFERCYGVDIRPANATDHRPYCIPVPAGSDPSAIGQVANFAAPTVFESAGLLDRSESRKYLALFALDDDGETPILMVRRCDRVSVEVKQRAHTSKTVPA